VNQRMVEQIWCWL